MQVISFDEFRSDGLINQYLFFNF